MKKSKINTLSTIVAVILLIVGLSIMFYPGLSNWWNKHTQTVAITKYTEKVDKMDSKEKKEIFARAHEYNRELAKLSNPLEEYKKIKDYDKILDISGTGIMGYVNIPKIGVNLPIYHGTSKEVLNIAVGHLQGTSLPVGGADTHAVISAHRGLPSAKLFTDLDKLDPGDTFTITVLDKVYTYEVEKSLIVLPEETEKTAIIPQKDYVTLMTCTPYGINTHRLLVRAHRIGTPADNDFEVKSDAVTVDNLRVIPFILAPLIVILLVYWYLSSKVSKAKKKKKFINKFKEGEK